ncbi:tetratricopeptide repeat protein [uncultured Mucilaginibacter sp.]|uniref:tetratricopeptide repeat protein n=1 Tax=uncultured Mucilaginibacter sp. TaxID=797541 RepID=UPI0025EEC7E9|nr:tetratricopeptide repeat protein [uncultured Mucilaginibacter sp.]
MKKLIVSLLLLLAAGVAFSQPNISPSEQAGTDLYKQGKMDEAITAFKKALVENPQSLYSMNALGNLYLMNANYQDAYVVADKGFKITGGAPNFMVVKAKAAIRINKAQEALTMVDDYLKTHQPDFMMLFVKGSAYNVLGDRQQALAFFSQSIAANPDFPDAYLGRGKDLDDIGRYPQALKDLDKYISLRDDNAQAYYDRSLVYFHSGDFNAALGDCNKSLAFDPKNASFLEFRGEVYAALKQPEMALADFNAAIAIAPGYAVPYYQVAGTYLNAKEYSKALPFINKAIELIPNAKEYFWIRCRLYLYLNKNAEALADAQKAMALDDKAPDGYVCLAEAQYNLDKYEDAVKTATKGIAVNPDYYLLYMLRATFYRDKGNTAMADADDQKAKQLAGNIK